MGQDNSKDQNSLHPNSWQKPSEKHIQDSIKNLQDFTIEEVATHNSNQDAWVIVKGFVFDVTLYAPSHPGGSKILLAKAGMDVTADFEALKHSMRAQDKLKTLCVGKVSQKK